MASRDQSSEFSNSLNLEDFLQHDDDQIDQVHGRDSEDIGSFIATVQTPAAQSSINESEATNIEEPSRQELLQKQLDCYETALTIESSMYHALTRTETASGSQGNNYTAAQKHSWWYWFLEERKNYVLDALEKSR